MALSCIVSHIQQQQFTSYRTRREAGRKIIRYGMKFTIRPDRGNPVVIR